MPTRGAIFPATLPSSPVCCGPLSPTRADFSYDALTAALSAIVAVAERPIEIGVISTVLPGTVRSALLPVVAPHSLVYCPQFVAMGTVARDLCYPEFTLLGYANGAAAEARPQRVRGVLEGLRAQAAPILEMSYESAELAKVAYNTFVTAKITVANVVQQMAQLAGASADDVFAVLRSAGQRLASASYLGPGMADGGPCHPRDNIALSWLAGEMGLKADLFTALMLQREAYVEWLCDEFTAVASGRPMVLLGTAYKPGVPLETGSSAILLTNLAAARGLALTVVRDAEDLAALDLDGRPGAFFLGCPMPEFLAYRFPAGSVVLDPWHRLAPVAGVDVRQIGEQR